MLISVLCFGYLAFLSPDLRWLYVFAAVTAGSGPPFALTVLRRTNGELSLRCLVSGFLCLVCVLALREKEYHNAVYKLVATVDEG